MEGFSHIFGPTGGIGAGPAEGETILTATGNTETVLGEKTWCDIGGHYSRPDVLQLHVNRASPQSVVDYPSKIVVPSGIGSDESTVNSGGENGNIDPI